MIRRRRLALLVALVVLAAHAPALVPVANGQSPTPPPLPEWPPDAAAGLEMFARECAPCHGNLGRGAGELVGDLPAPPPSFADVDTVRGRSPAEAFDIVTNGRLESLMPPWRDRLDAAERWNALFGAWSFYYTPDRLARGRATWAAACAECHALDGSDAVPWTDLAWMGARSQADLFEAARVAHKPLSAQVADEDLWSALDHARASTFDPLPYESLTVDGRIDGRIVNGTPGGASTSDAVVRLVPFAADGNVPGDPITVTVGADGHFEATGLAAGPEIVYGLAVSYGGVDYTHEGGVQPQPTGGEVLEITVYEPSLDVSLEVTAAHTVLSPAPDAGVVAVTEVWTVLNTSQSTLVAGEGAETLRFELLPGARDVDVGDLRMRGSASLAGNVLLDQLAVPPGEREVVITYDVPYAGSVLEIERAFDLPTADFRLLVTGEGVGIESEDLEAPEAIAVEGRSVTGARAADLAPGARIRARITGLPAVRAGDPQAVVRALPPPLVSPAWLAAGVLALTAAGVAAVVLYPGPGGWQPVAARRRRLDEERRRLVGALARLDGEHAAGGLGDEAFARRRAELLDRAIAVARRQRELEEGA